MFRYVVDWDFWLRVSRRWQVVWLAKPTVQIRWHSGSETHRFAVGTDDLDETSRLLEQLFEIDWKDRPDVAAMRRTANTRLGRAFLNRAFDALHAGRPIARDALRRGLTRSPRSSARSSATLAFAFTCPPWPSHPDSRQSSLARRRPSIVVLKSQ